MLPYQEETRKLEELLERLFNDGSTPEDVQVLRKPFPPGPLSDCCSYNYGGD